MTEDRDALIASKPHLLAVPFLDARVKVGGQLAPVWYVNAPMGSADGIAHAKRDQLLLGLCKLDRKGFGKGGRNVAFARFMLPDVIKFRLFDGGQLDTKYHKRILFLCSFYADSGAVQIPDEFFVVEVCVIGDADKSQSLRLCLLCDRIERVRGIVGVLAMNVPI